VSERPERSCDIEERLRSIRARIRERTDREVRIVAVTKGHPVEVLESARLAGCADLGESYAQEMVAKLAELDARGSLGDRDVRWHFVGRLQSNKVRQLAGLVHLWHTIDRVSVAREVAKRDPGARVLVQLDLAGIAGRGGCPPATAPDLVERCRAAGLEVRGLMGVGVPGPAEGSRPAFAALVAMADSLGLEERCIGMSGDFEVAVEEGATMVRIGSALVGERPPRPV
jgi:PLP dependent protein